MAKAAATRFICIGGKTQIDPLSISLAVALLVSVGGLAAYLRYE